MQEALRLENISKKYKKFELQNVNMVLPKGSIMGFIGENGAGKSTTIKALLGLIKRDSGTVFINGTEFSGKECKVKENIGVVMDSTFFSEDLTAHEVERFMRRIYHNWDSNIFEGYLQDFSLKRSMKIKEYSRGMKMKLSLAVALSHNPDLLILDEATSGLDPVVRDHILDLFLDFIQDENHSILISSHILSDLEKICDYITFIHKGEILFSERKDDLLEEYLIVKGSKEQIEELDQSVVIGIKENSFGVQALVKADAVPQGMVTDRAGIEDIMLYFIKEGNR